MRHLTAVAFAFLVACGGGGGEPRSDFYDECIAEGRSESTCACLDTFAQAGKNPESSFDKLVRQCERNG